MLTGKCRYNEIRSLYIQQLAYAWIEDSTMETTCTNVEEKVKSFAEGDLEHATDIISALWEIANKDGEIKAPANTPSAVSSFHFHPFPRLMWKHSLHTIRPRSPRSPRVLPAGPL